jgi:hypothetical protein
LCQIGLNSTDQDPITNLISSYTNKMIIQVFGSNSRRKKRSNTDSNSNYTCSKLKQVGKGVIALSATQLAAIPLPEFVDCILSLGTITNWSPNQLSSLSNLVLVIFYILRIFKCKYNF